MENLLIIYVEETQVKFIFGPASMYTNITFEKVLYEYKYSELGYKTIEADIAYDILVEQQLENSELENELISYFECLLVGDSAARTSGQQKLSNQLKTILEQAKNRLEQEDITYFEKSDINEKLEELIKRVKFYLYKYVIEEIILVCKWELAFLVEKPIKSVFDRDLKLVNELTYSISTQVERTTKSKQINLRYLNDIHPIMKLDTLEKEKTGSVSFPVKFALDTHVNLMIFEEWKEKGIRKERALTHYSFYLPFFYTDDVIRLTSTYLPNKGYSFEVVHVETGEKDTFSYEDD
ncbi:hypothetical protein [Halalkalibacter urbisdiaboli]|uniref:hypothetical protein n=1 Tax=Halalkalibacter urbisdiaboli TaxID=1960589 RepID=UPI000B43985F|nr:hypothetical protein [Halalkalibacter urbisdiaboli]